MLFTPKYLLHHRPASSALRDLTVGNFFNRVIDDGEVLRCSHGLQCTLQARACGGWTRRAHARDADACIVAALDADRPCWRAPADRLLHHDVCFTGKSSDNTRHLAVHRATGEPYLLPPAAIRRVVLCTGQLYYQLSK